MLDVAPSSSIRPRMRSAFRPCPQDDGYVAQDGLNSGSAISRHAVVHSRAEHDREPCPSTTCIFVRSEEHTSELQSLMRISYAVFCLKKKNKTIIIHHYNHQIYSTSTTN